MATKKPTTTDENPEATRFDELRQRALKSSAVDTSKTTDTPFTMGAEWGFNEDPISIERPTFTKSELITENIKGGNVLNALRLLFGKDTGRVSAQLDALGKDAGPAALLLVDDVLSHFYGSGSVQVFPR